MNVDWELTPRMLFNQLSGPDRDRVCGSIAQLQEDFSRHRSPADVQELRVVPGSSRKLFVLGGSSFRVIFSHQDDRLVIVDLFPTSQIEKLRSLQRSH
ncbi:MAG: hypothetical protein ABSA58_20140 [Acetobacteraceae bacterium]